MKSEGREARWEDYAAICRLVVKFGDKTFTNTGLLQYLAIDPTTSEASVELAKLLLDEGADVNEVPRDECLYYSDDPNRTHRRRRRMTTALFHAASFNFMHMVELLLSSGADPRIKCHPPLPTSVMQIAARPGNKDLRELLDKYGHHQ